MCCETGSHHGSHRWGHHPAAHCGCTPVHHRSCCGGKEDQVAHMEQCLEGLQQKAKAVEERLAALKEEG